MKKLLAYILFTILLSLSLSTFASAETFENNTNSQTLIAADTEDTEESKYVQPIIPKPTYLPGPEEDQQVDSMERDPETGELPQTGGRKLFITQILPRIAVMMIGFVGGLSLVFLLIAGVRFATNYGNEEAIENAKKQAIFSILGFLLALLSYTIVAIVSNVKFFGDETVRTGETLQESQEDPDDTLDRLLDE